MVLGACNEVAPKKVLRLFVSSSFLRFELCRLWLASERGVGQPRAVQHVARRMYMYKLTYEFILLLAPKLCVRLCVTAQCYCYNE